MTRLLLVYPVMATMEQLPPLEFEVLVQPCPVSDGAAAVILASEEGLAKLGKKPEDCIELLAYAISTSLQTTSFM